MGTAGYATVVVGAVVIGVIAQYALRGRFGYEWLATAIGAGIGGFVASEYLGRLSDWGTDYDGLRIFPALIGAVVVAAIVEAAIFYAVRPTART